MNRQQRRAAEHRAPTGAGAVVMPPPDVQRREISALYEAGRLPQAVRAIRLMLKHTPDDALSWSLLGAILQAQDDVAGAERAFAQALRIDPASSKGWLNLAGTFKEQGRLDDALAATRRALMLSPGDGQAHFDLSLLLLSLGLYAEGWPAYEWRMRVPGVGIHKGFVQPQWNGGDLTGKTLLVHAEQGLGDVIQFARYLPLLAERAKKVLFVVPPSLVTLFRDLAGADALLTGEGRPPVFDLHCPLLSLPKAFGTGADTIPANVPYLLADPAKVAAAADRWPSLAAGGVTKVGLVWSGDPRPENRAAGRMDAHRSLALKAFSPLAKIQNVQFFSLQKGAAARQAGKPPAGLRLIDPMTKIADFAETAAIIEHLDLVISVDTAVAHLAGAMGKPVWILSRFDGCWRWLRGRDDSPWYPTARLFRQETPGDWRSVLVRVAEALGRVASHG